MVCFTFLVVLSLGPLGQFLGELVPKENAGLQFAARAFGTGVALGVYVLLVRFVERRQATELEWKFARVELAIGLLLGLLLFSAVMGILIAAGFQDVRFNGIRPAWEAAGSALEAGIVEELIIRGILLRLLWRAFGPATAFTFSAVLFGAGHLPNSGSSLFAAACIAIEAGIMLGAFYALTGRLWVSIGFHTAWNFTQGYLFGAAVSGVSLGASVATSAAVKGTPDWLSGGSFGPEASLPALLICGSLGFAVCWAAWKARRFGKSNGSEEPSTAPSPAAAA
jgi:membrane protease YdiL (CAAX protease family)